MKNSSKGHVAPFSMGTFIKCPHPEMIEALALSGMDFAVVDMEHVHASTSQLYPLKLAADAKNFDLIVRVPVNSEEYIKWCLDLGYQYIQIPFVQTRAEAEKSVKLSMFSPIGERGFCRFVRAAGFSQTDRNQYLAESNSNTKLILQIEGKLGVDNIDEILKVDGFYAIFIGPYDLSQSLGIPGDIWNKKVTDAMLTIVRKCKDKNIKTGTFTDTPEGVDFWSKVGIDFIEYASDLNVLIDAYKKQFGHFKA